MKDKPLDVLTPSELAVRGKNKEGKDWLRQIGLALLVSRESEIPFFTRSMRVTAMIQGFLIEF